MQHGAAGGCGHETARNAAPGLYVQPGNAPAPGYSSDTVASPKYGLNMEASPSLQREYVTDLADLARKGNYLFTVFFLSVDCDALMSKLPGEAAANGFWTHSGFFDKKMKKKLTWVAYQEAWLGRTNTGPVSQIPNAN